MDKVTRYGWGVKDAPGTLTMLEKNQIIVDRSYQRDLNVRKVLTMASDWSWIACGVITVAIRDGVFYCIDGQHRVAAAMRRSDICQLPCLVFKTESSAEEAAGFLNSNTLNKPVTSYGKFRAMVEAKDPTAVYVKSLLDKHGLKALPDDGSKIVRTIGRIMELCAMDRERFTKVFNFCVELCVPMFQINKIILDGLDYLDSHISVEDGISNPALKKRILSIGPESLNSQASRAMAVFGVRGAKQAAIGMLEAINKNLHHKYEMK